jgi:arsenate reductase-like glutaredoxin family protein
MIYLFYGTDRLRARNTTHKAVEAAQKKHVDAEFFKLSTDNFSADKLDELITNQGLFYSGSIVFADSLFADSNISEIILKKIKEISESPNFFVFLEEKLNKKELEKLVKYSQKVEEFKKAEKSLNKKEALALKGEKIDFFEFANALGEKNKKLLWTLYQEALIEEVPSEEVHAIFFWQVKAMLSALKSREAVEAGLNPYVYTKSKAYAKNYGEEKLREMSAVLFQMYHEAHRGNIDFAVSLEKFILNL